MRRQQKDSLQIILWVYHCLQRLLEMFFRNFSHFYGSLWWVEIWKCKFAFFIQEEAFSTSLLFVETAIRKLRPHKTLAAVTNLAALARWSTRNRYDERWETIIIHNLIATTKSKMSGSNEATPMEVENDTDTGSNQTLQLPWVEKYRPQR